MIDFEMDKLKAENAMLKDQQEQTKRNIKMVDTMYGQADEKLNLSAFHSELERNSFREGAMQGYFLCWNMLFDQFQKELEDLPKGLSSNNDEKMNSPHRSY